MRISFILWRKCHVVSIHICQKLAEWKIATVQFNYHIAVDGIYYSVPHQYIKDKVDVRVKDTTIEVFYHHDRIASHRRLHGRNGQYSTVTEHMPDDHQKYLEWNGDRFRRWRTRSDQTNERRLMQSLPPDGSNSSHTGAVWVC